MSIVVQTVSSVVQSRLMADHCFGCIRLWQDMHFPAPRSHEDGRRITTMVIAMFMSGSVLSASLFDDELVPARYRRFFSMLLSRTRHLTPSPTRRFFQNVHDVACSNAPHPSKCMQSNIGILGGNVTDLSVVYARLFAIPLSIAIGRRLFVHAPAGGKGLTALVARALLEYFGEVLVATLRLSLGVLCAQTYLTLVDTQRCPHLSDYHVASAVATAFLLIGEAPKRVILITRHCTALFICMLLNKSPLKRHAMWRVLFVALLLLSLTKRGITRTARSLVV